MRKKTHGIITSSIGREIKKRYGLEVLFKGGKYPDSYRRKRHPHHQEIELNKHHDIELNRERIKKLIFYARDSYQNNELEDAVFDYCIALHFLCDSVIPSLDDNGRWQQEMLEELFEKVEIDIKWNYIPESKFDDLGVVELINDFLNKMPISIGPRYKINMMEIKDIMKDLYQTGLKMAIYVFGDYFWEQKSKVGDMSSSKDIKDICKIGKTNMALARYLFKHNIPRENWEEYKKIWGKCYGKQKLPTDELLADNIGIISRVSNKK